MQHCLAQIVLALGLMVKVASFNAGTGQVTFHLPMHNTNIVAILEGGQSSKGIKRGAFYQADAQGQILVVEVKNRSVRFVVEKLAFIEPR